MDAAGNLNKQTECNPRLNLNTFFLCHRFKTINLDQRKKNPMVSLFDHNKVNLNPWLSVSFGGAGSTKKSSTQKQKKSQVHSCCILHEVIFKL